MRAADCVRCGRERTLADLDAYDYSICRECIADRWQQGYGNYPYPRNRADFIVWDEIAVDDEQVID